MGSGKISPGVDMRGPLRMSLMIKRSDRGGDFLLLVGGDFGEHRQAEHLGGGLLGYGETTGGGGVTKVGETGLQVQREGVEP